MSIEEFGLVAGMAAENVMGSLLKNGSVAGTARSTREVSVGSLADWVAQIKEAFGQGRSSTLELARVLSTARRKLLFGEWTQMWKSAQLPFAQRKGDMLVTVGNSLGDLDAHHCARLPSAWKSLYYLAKLHRLVLLSLISQGTVHPALTIKQAKDLLPLHKPNPSSTAPASRVKRRISGFCKFVQSTLGDWTQNERETARLALLQLALDIRGNVAAVPELCSSPINGKSSVRIGPAQIPNSVHRSPDRFSKRL